MVKKPKVIRDIRYFHSPDWPCSQPSLLGNKWPLLECLDLSKHVHILGQRIASVLRSNGYSVGSYDHVYVVYTLAAQSGVICPSVEGIEPWFRFVACGISPDFKLMNTVDKINFIQSSTFSALRSLQTEASDILEQAFLRINSEGEKTRILHLSKSTKQYSIEIWYDVLEPKTSSLYVILRDKSSGEVKESKPFPLEFHQDIYPLVSSITFKDTVVTLNPKESFRADLIVKEYPSPLCFNVTEFALRSSEKK